MHGRHPVRLKPLAFLALLFTICGPDPGAATEPGTPPPVQAIARVLGEDIPAGQKQDLSARILPPLLDQFAKENRIEPDEAEIAAFLKWLDRIQEIARVRQQEFRKTLESELSAGNLSEPERQQKEARLKQIRNNDEAERRMKEQGKGKEDQIREALRQTAQSHIRRWMIFKALHDRYGGRIAFQQAGAEPVEALRDFLKEKEQAGSFQILDPEEAARFWRYFTDPSVHHFFPEAEGNHAINTPLWRMEKPPGQ